MVGLLVLTSVVQLILIMKMLFTFVTKQATLIRRSTVLSLPFKLVFPFHGALWYKDRRFPWNRFRLDHSGAYKHYLGPVL